ncbi:MAG: alpha/beta fold hydrolase [Nevskia sp.]|nr:alpha/beta fold hydrolase [Nevskia sp.]
MAYAEVNGVDLYYDDIGSGVAVVMLHGLGASHEDWESQRTPFSRAFRVIAPDLRGFGASGRVGEYTIAQFADDVWALLEQLKVKRFHLIGHSMGGAVALQMAIDRPERIRRLVLADTLPSFETNTLGKRMLFAYRYAMMGVFGPQRLTKAVARKLFPGSDREQVRLRERAVRRGNVNDRTVYLETIRNLLGWKISDQLQLLTMPSLVIAAEYDYFPVSDAEAFAAALPNAALKVFAGAHHAVPLEIPQAFNTVVIDFLQLRGTAVRKKASALRRPALKSKRKIA